MKHKKKVPTHPCFNCPHKKDENIDDLSFPKNLLDTPKSKSIYPMLLTLDEYKIIIKLFKKEEDEPDTI